MNVYPEKIFIETILLLQSKPKNLQKSKKIKNDNTLYSPPYLIQTLLHPTSNPPKE